jgi:hypothetical protein
LDQFGGSAAAFSLRNLSSSYRGPLVRVRRSSDNAETDIGGTFGGDLDVNSLLAFTGGQNLFTNSEDFTNAAWFKSGATITANATIAPDGTLTADKLVETATTSGHGFEQTSTTSQQQQFCTTSLYVKAAERSMVRITVYAETTPFSTYFVIFDLTNSSKIEFANNSAILSSSSIRDVGNGWYRISVTGRTGQSGNNKVFIVAENTFNASAYLGVAGFGLFVWGAQLTTGSVLQPYIPTTTAAINGANAFVTKWYDQSGIGDNTVLDSQEFNLWTAVSISVSANSTTAPDGTLTADTITHTAAAGEIFEYFSSPVNSIFTSSVYVKYINTQWIRFNVGFGNGAYAAVAWFDCLNGVVGSTQLIGSPAPSISNLAISNAGNGWWRISFSCVASTALVQNYIQLNSATADSSSTRVNGASYFVWGAQVSNGSELLRYQPTTTAIAPKRDAVQTTAASQPRIVNAGSVESENGKPSIFFDGTDDRLSFDSAASAFSGEDVPVSAFSLVKQELQSAWFLGLGSSTVSLPIHGYGINSIGIVNFRRSDANIQVTIPNINISTEAQVNSHLFQGTTLSVSNNGINEIINGSMNVGPLTLDRATIGALVYQPSPSGSSFFRGDLSEFTLYNTNQSSNASTIQSNINTYYQIYWQGNGTALLDSFSGASAAYSLRNLSSAYTGPLIRVRRSNDNVERDIFGTFRGDLDLAALTSFVGANSGFVTTWYDQSGTGRHATQATAASQPRIVNAGAVDTQNGKPAVWFDGTDDRLVSFIDIFLTDSKTLFGAFALRNTTNTFSCISDFSSVGTPAAYGPLVYLGSVRFEINNLSNNGTAVINTPYIITSDYTKPAGSAGTIRKNGVDSASGYRTNGLGGNNGISIGSRPDGTWPAAMTAFEFMCYTTDVSTGIAPIETNINNYYKIY